ncbi:MAG: hypothetical protein JRN21_04535 [Nitrososphaerota archaeon]|nr:hypothetical protein [Nitrososphaerota archaeon]
MPVPLVLGITAPSGRDVWELYFKVESRPSILGKITDVLGAHNIDILGSHGQVSDDRKVGHILMFVEMQGADVDTERVMSEFRAMPFVLDIRAESKRKIIFESQMFPLTSGGHYRGFFIGASSWAALVNTISAKFGSGGDVILQAEGESVGREVTVKVREKLSKDGEPGAGSDDAAMLENVKAVFKADGLGLLDLSVGSDGTVEASVSEAATTVKSDHHVDHFIIGFVRGALEVVFSAKYSVEKLRLEDGKIMFSLARS